MQIAITFFILFSSLLIPSFINAHEIPPEQMEMALTGGVYEYLWLGGSHMLTGLDHLLFIFGVIFFLNSIWDIVKYISFFTLGHSLTLIFATFYEISASEYLVDAVIALSVVYKGFDNLDGFKKVFKIKSPNLAFIIFVFGLIHGFGLSTRLQAFYLSKESLLIKILSFNLGVELGQIAALIPMVFLLKWLKKSHFFDKLSILSNAALIFVGFALFFVQLNGYFDAEKLQKNRQADLENIRKSGEIKDIKLLKELEGKQGVFDE